MNVHTCWMLWHVQDEQRAQIMTCFSPHASSVSTSVCQPHMWHVSLLVAQCARESGRFMQATDAWPTTTRLQMKHVDGHTGMKF
jgi:hypothetical protein